MNERTRIAALALAMLTVALVVGAISVVLPYRAAFAQTEARLTETARSQARTIEAMARFDAESSRDYPGGPAAATLSQIRDAHQRYEGMGETGELTLAMREGDQIVFLLSHRHFDRDLPQPVRFDSEWAEPMRRGLSGQSGTVVGLDYRGETVVAAYEPVAELDLGIVAKIDLAEIRAPFVKTSLVAGLCGLLAIALGAVLFVKATNPLVQRLGESEVRHRTLFETMTLGVVYQSAKGEITAANPAAERILGLTVDQMQDRASVDPRWRSIHEDGSDFPGENHPAMMALRTGEEVRNTVMGVYNPVTDGRTWININSVPQFGDNGGRPEQVYTTFEDITERRRARESLEQEYRLREAENAVRLSVASINDPRDLEGMLAAVSTQLTGLGVAHDGISLQVMNTAGTDFYSAGEQIERGTDWKSLWDGLGLVFVNQQGIVSFKEDYRKRTREFSEDAAKVIEVWRNGTFRYVPCAPEGLGVVSGRAIVDVAFSHGTLAINSKQPNAFSGEDIALLQCFAKIVTEGFQRFLHMAERTQAEASLRESEERYRLLVERLPIGIAHTTPDGRILYHNPHAQQITGFTPQDLSGMTAEDVYVHPGDREDLLRNLEEKGEHTFECLLRRKDGGTVWVHGTTRVIKDSEGKIIELEGTTEDISERKQAEEKAQFLSAVTRNIDDSILVTDTNYAITYMNGAAERLFGYSLDDLRGKTPDILNAEPMADQNQQALYEAASSGKEYLGEFLNRRKDGSTFICELRVMPLRGDDGRVLSYVGIQRDITERKRLEQEVIHLERMRVSGELAAGVSHNLNNMLTAVLAPAQILLRKSDDPVIRREAETILAAGRRAQDLVLRCVPNVRERGFRLHV